MRPHPGAVPDVSRHYQQVTCHPASDPVGSHAVLHLMSAYPSASLRQKSIRYLLARPTVTFPFIAEHSQQYPIRLLRSTFEVSERGYSAWLSREPSAQDREDARLSAEMQQIFLEHRQAYGSPRIHAVLKARSMHCGRKRVVGLMQPWASLPSPTVAAGPR